MQAKEKIRKVLLVFPPVVNTRSTNNISCVPLGIAYLGAYLRREGYEVELLDAAVEGYHNEVRLNPQLVRFGLAYEEIAERVVQSKPDVLGVSCIFSSQMPGVRRITEDAKNALGDLITVTGGTHPSFMAREVLQHEPLDFVVRGEGELAFANLLNALNRGESPDGVKGIAYRADGRVMLTPPEDVIPDIDSIPWPARDLLPMEKYFRINAPMQSLSKRQPNTSFITSRGCPYRCNFCSSSRHWRKYRARNVDDVLDEIGHLIGTYGVRELKFEDDNLTFDYERSRALFTGMAERGYDITWNTPNGVAVRTLTEEMLSLMKRAGCYEVTLAIESGDPYVLRNIVNKPLDLAQAELAAKRCKKLGIETAGYFIFGFPGETREQIFRTFKFARRLKLDRAYFFIFNPLVGTPLHEKCVREGLLTDNYSSEDDNYFISRFKSPHWTAEELYKWQKQTLWTYNLLFAARNPVRFFRKYYNSVFRNPRILAKGLGALCRDSMAAVLSRSSFGKSTRAAVKRPETIDSISETPGRAIAAEDYFKEKRK